MNMYQNPSYVDLACIQDANAVVSDFVDNLVFFLSAETLLLTKIGMFLQI